MPKNINVKTLYPDDKTASKASLAIGFLNILLTIVWWGGWVFILLSVYSSLRVLVVEAVNKSFEVITTFMVLVSSVSVIIVATVLREGVRILQDAKLTV